MEEAVERGGSGPFADPKLSDAQDEDDKGGYEEEQCANAGPTEREEHPEI